MTNLRRTDHFRQLPENLALRLLPLTLAACLTLAGACSKQTLDGSGQAAMQTNTSPPAGQDPNAGLPVQDMAAKATSYAITYGALDDVAIETLKTYPLVIVHPYNGSLTASQIFRIKQGIDPKSSSDNVVVLCYISIGEDDRTFGLSDEQMLADKRFTGDGSGPSIDPRTPGERSLDLQRMGLSNKGKPTGGGYASYYLNDNATRCNDPKNKPDRNPNFQTRFVNAGDPDWYEVVSNMEFDKSTHTPPGLKQLLSADHPKKIGCDGVFLDTIDTAAPNFYTSCNDPTNPNHSSSEWTAQGFTEFIQRLRKEYPDKVILQNRGLFYFDPRLPQYEVFKRGNIDLGFFESYYLGNNSDTVVSPFFNDNRYNVVPKLMAEANRPNGFKVLSLGYANGFGGPKAGIDFNVLLGTSSQGYDILKQDILYAQEAGFTPYISNASVDLVNSFVKNNTTPTDSSPPVWSSTYNDNYDPPQPPSQQRIGLQKAEVTAPGSVKLSWDVALDRNRVSYLLYYQKSATPFDFATATRVLLNPTPGDGYDQAWNKTSPSQALRDVYPHQQTISGLQPGASYRFVIRAVDSSGNEDSNNNFIEVTP